MSPAQKYRHTQTVDEYLENWESLDDDERAQAWQEMDAGLKSYIRNEKDGDDWEQWTYTPDEWNAMSADEREETWDELPDYERTFLAEQDEYDTTGIEPSQDDTGADDESLADTATDAMHSSGYPGLMATGAAVDMARYAGKSMIDTLEETMKDHAMDYVNKIGTEQDDT